MSDAVTVVTIINYTNHRGERGDRRIIPLQMFFGASDWHDGIQWFLRAIDTDKGAERVFAMKDIHSWRSAEGE